METAKLHRTVVVCVYHSRRQLRNRLSERLRARPDVELCEIYPEENCDFPDFESFNAVISFGGTNSANDDHVRSVRSELRWTEGVIKRNKPFLGICLGAQIMARVLGGKIEQHPEGMAEIGFYKVRPTVRGAKILSNPTYFYQWHREGMTVPPCSTLLATGDIFEVQAIGYRNATGLMFHPEATTKMIRSWIQIGSHRLTLAGAQDAERQTKMAAVHEPVIEQWISTFLPRWINGEIRW